MRKIAFALAILAVPHAAHACGVPDLGRMLGEVAEAMSSKPEPVTTPDVLVGGWPQRGFTIAAGLLWGEKDAGTFLPGSDVSRVLVTMHDDAHADLRSLAVTYGRFGSLDPFGVAADLGVSAAGDGVGPTGSVQLGLAGFSLRLTGTVPVSSDAHLDGRAEVVVDVANVIGKI